MGNRITGPGDAYKYAQGETKMCIRDSYRQAGPPMSALIAHVLGKSDRDRNRRLDRG